MKTRSGTKTIRKREDVKPKPTPILDKPSTDSPKPDDNKSKTIKKRPKNSIKISSKVYSTNTPNSKGIKIGKYQIIIHSDDFPVSSMDETDYLLGEVIDYSNFMGNYKNQYRNENLEKNNKNFFKAETQDWYMIPITYKKSETSSLSGDKKLTNKISPENIKYVIRQDKKIKELEQQIELLKK